jgi:hypothetical protein
VKSSLPEYLHNIFDNHNLDSIDDSDNLEWIKLDCKLASRLDNTKVLMLYLLLSSLEIKKLLLYWPLVAGPSTCILPNTVFGRPTMCFGVCKAATNICKQGASALVKRATVRMLQINNPLIGHFSSIPSASPLFYDSISHLPSAIQNPRSLSSDTILQGQTTPKWQTRSIVVRIAFPVGIMSPTVIFLSYYLSSFFYYWKRACSVLYTP